MKIRLYLMRARPHSRPAYELTNMLTVSALLATAALLRTESRGTHFRTDHPERADDRWCRHVFLDREADGTIRATRGELCPPTDSR